MIKYFEKPTQVKFFDKDNNIWVGGIAYHGEIICGCCGGTLEIDELAEHEMVIYDDWVNLSYEIIGED